MFKRLIVDNWVNYVPMVTFGLTAFVFITMTLRAFVIKKDEADRLANLPNDDQSKPQ